MDRVKHDDSGAAADAKIPPELRAIPRRRRSAHKGDFGRILIVGGSFGMHGAPLLAAAAALKSGAGLVTVALPRSIYTIAGGAELRATYRPLPESAHGALVPAALPLLQSACEHATVVAVGPGLGTSKETVALLHEWLPTIEKPLVVDADGLNAFAGRPEDLAGRRPATILTPHPRELARLTGQQPGDDDESRRVAAVDLAMRIGGVVVLKGQRSVVTNGLEAHFNPTGNPGMASGGAGDVLTGCVAALLAVIPDALKAARVAVFAHGRAGDVAAREQGEIGVTATDLVAHLPRALAELVA